MAKKTISGHYGAVYNLGHNNRDVMPPNADPRRTCNNYNLVASGHEVSKNYTEYKSMNELWSDYRSLTSAYWNGYAAEKDDISALYQKVREKRREEREWLRLMTPNIYTLWIILLLLPLYIYIGVQKHQELQRLEEKLRTAKFESWVKRETFFGRRACLRDALRRYDREAGTQIVQRLDTLVHESEYVLDTRFRQPEPVRFATIEEIYNHVFEPGFRAFQAKQRPRRRYNGTYLEKIREDKAVREKAGNRSSQCPAEAIEVLFSIGDMDNTGYKAAPEDATKAETLLRALCDHLLADPHVCVVTTKELENPDWQPPFKHGLILTNLVGHFDEATPGVHATFIPYSRGCARGPAVQPSLGRAMAGMGYPSTWKLQLDEQGNPIPKLDRYGKPVTEKDGSIRYKKSPDQQGIIDWIEEQKTWLQNEMKSRYGWDREYKGSHPRGYLSIPDYKVVKAQERLQEIEEKIQKALSAYEQQTKELSKLLTQSVDDALDHNSNFEIILQYIQICPDEKFGEILNDALTVIEDIPEQMQEHAKRVLLDTIKEAEKRSLDQKKLPFDFLNNGRMCPKFCVNTAER